MTAKRSIFQAMPLQDVLKWDGPLFTRANAIQGAFGLIQILKVVKVFEDGLADIESLGATSATSELFEALFDGLRETNCQH
jgi:hypothetical protein